MDRASWCYVCGLISAQWERLLGQRDFLGLMKMTAEEERRTRLRSSLLFAETPPDDRPEDQIESAFENLVRRIADISPDGRIADLFLLERDWRQFRKFAKSLMLEVTASAPGGEERKASESETRFSSCWKGQVEDERARPFAEAAARITSELPRQGDHAGWIDHVVDAYESASLVRAAEGLESAELLDWIRAWVNLRAGLSLLRARRIGWEAEELLGRWRTVGFDDPALADMASGNEAAWPLALRKLGLPGAEAACAADAAMVQLSREIDRRVSELASASSGMPFGPERVFAFLWALRAEAINLRLALAAAAFGVPEERVAGELRVGYV